MMQVANQFRRIFSDNGSGDKDFAESERKLRAAHQYLLEATTALRHASEVLTDLIKSKGLIH